MPQEYGDAEFGKLAPKYRRLRRRIHPPMREVLFERSAADIAIAMGVSIRTVQRWRKLVR